MNENFAAGFQKVQTKLIKPYLSGTILRNVESPLSCHRPQRGLVTAQHFWAVTQDFGSGFWLLLVATGQPGVHGEELFHPAERVRAVGTGADKCCDVFLQKPQWVLFRRQGKFSHSANFISRKRARGARLQLGHTPERCSALRTTLLPVGTEEAAQKRTSQSTNECLIEGLTKLYLITSRLHNFKALLQP